MKIELQRVQYMPKELHSGILYVSEEFGTAAHLCACGCGAKIRTPLGLTEWEFEATDDGPTLRPSIGSWQLPCQSHYWICCGEIKWSAKWTPAQIALGRQRDEARRDRYFNSGTQRSLSLNKRAWVWIKGMLKKQ